MRPALANRTFAARAVLVVLLGACCAGPAAREGQSPQEDDLLLRGAGATFPALLYTHWITEYGRTHPEPEIVYDPIGSSAGLQALAEGRVDFAASEAPPEQESAGRLAGTIQIPLTLGAIAVVYNVPGVDAGLRLGSDELAAIFLGEIRQWDDPRLRELNPHLPLPDLSITVVHRQEGSGTTAVFTRYLAAISAPFREKVGSGSLVGFPVGEVAAGNEGVAGRVKVTRGAIGYVQLSHARRLELAVAEVRNRAGRFVRPSLAAMASAARQGLSDATTTSVLDPPGMTSYPIATYSYVVVYPSSSDAPRTRALAHFLSWCLHEGQALAPALVHAPLPEPVVRRAEDRLRRLEINGGSARGAR